ncbi:inhibitor of growth protein [Musa troglodytarum]|uniref:Inhibitor of growth protein n=1 Tax=Musa troglodytarum TaxID=320322 RepID=A0A9E7E996_9LILI|nr:inhibitor of growth protein [Musa troglodytarum]
MTLSSHPGILLEMKEMHSSFCRLFKILEAKEKLEGIINQTKEQTRYCSGMPFHNSKRVIHDDDEAELEKMKKEIEASQENALSLCTEKVLLAQQACELLSSYISIVASIVKTVIIANLIKGKIPPDEPAILPPLPIVNRDEKRKGGYLTPQPKRLRERDWDRDRDMDIELMPPPGSDRKNIPASADVDQPIDPNEPTYCVCHQVSFGDMIACDNENVSFQTICVKEVNGSIIHVLDSLQKQDLKGSGSAQPVGINNDF